MVYVEAPLRQLFEAFGEDFSDFLSDLEIGVSDPWGTTLPLDSDGSTVPSQELAIANVV